MERSDKADPGGEDDEPASRDFPCCRQQKYDHFTDTEHRIPVCIGWHDFQSCLVDQEDKQAQEVEDARRHGEAVAANMLYRLPNASYNKSYLSHNVSASLRLLTFSFLRIR